MNQHVISAWRDEQCSAYLYKVIAAVEPIESRRQLFLQLSHEAEQQASIWAKELGEANASQLIYQPDMRTRIICWLIRRLGPRNIKPILAAIKIRGLSVYNNRHDSDHHPQPTSVEEIGASHKGTGTSGGLRAAVFGINDGLVSIACLVMGIAGAASSNGVILMTGIAGLLAGAFSMAAGEYISMRSQREMFEYQIGLERAELAKYPEEEAGELTLIYVARGMEEEDAKKLAHRMVSNPELGLDTLAREELGLNPDELGSPWVAAISSFIAFAAGGLIPLIPFLFKLESHALDVAIGLTGLSLFGIGALLSLFTGRNAIKGGLRMLFIGGAAGLLTYWIGDLLGANLS